MALDEVSSRNSEARRYPCLTALVTGPAFLGPAGLFHFISSEDRASPLPVSEMTLPVFSLWFLGERCKAEKSLMNQKHILERTNEATWQSCQMVCWGLSGSWHPKGQGVRQPTGLSSLV